MLEQAAVSRSSTGFTGASGGQEGINQFSAGPCGPQPALLQGLPCPAHWSSLLTLPLLLPVALKMFPGLPHQVSLVGVCSCQGAVSHRGDLCLEPGTNIDPSAGAERPGVRPALVGTGNLTFSLGWEGIVQLAGAECSRATAACREPGSWDAQTGPEAKE